MADHRSIFIELENMASDRAIEAAALTVFSVQWDRIFSESKDSSGAALPELSKKPLYINTTKNSPKAIAPKGKTGKSKFASGKPHVTTYFPGGYKEFKSQIGRPKLELFGDMRKSYVAGMVGGRAAYGFTDSTQAEKADGIETRWKREIFFNTDAETDLFIDLLTKR